MHYIVFRDEETRVILKGQRRDSKAGLTVFETLPLSLPVLQAKLKQLV